MKLYALIILLAVLAMGAVIVSASEEPLPVNEVHTVLVTDGIYVKEYGVHNEDETYFAEYRITRDDHTQMFLVDSVEFYFPVEDSGNVRVIISEIADSQRRDWNDFYSVTEDSWRFDEGSDSLLSKKLRMGLSWNRRRATWFTTRHIMRGSSWWRARF